MPCFHLTCTLFALHFKFLYSPLVYILDPTAPRAIKKLKMITNYLDQISGCKKHNNIKCKINKGDNPVNTLPYTQHSTSCPGWFTPVEQAAVPIEWQAGLAPETVQKF